MRQQANEEAFRRLVDSEPVLTDVMPATEALGGMTQQTILASGPPLQWAEFVGGQREAIIGAALFEGLARDRGEAEDMLSRGTITVPGLLRVWGGRFGSRGLHRFDARVRGA